MCGGTGHLGLTHTETQRGRLWTACGQRRVDSKNSQTTRQQPAHPQCANYWALLTRKRHTMPHSAQPQHTNYWAPRTRKRHQQEHRPQRPTESSDPTQHAKGRTSDCLGPRKGATTRRNVTQGGGGGASAVVSPWVRFRLSDQGRNLPPNCLTQAISYSFGLWLTFCFCRSALGPVQRVGARAGGGDCMQGVFCVGLFVSQIAVFFFFSCFMFFIITITKSADFYQIRVCRNVSQSIVRRAPECGAAEEDFLGESFC